MSTKYWLADVPTAWDTGAAWTGGVKPGGSDDAVFRGDHVGDALAPAGAETVGNVYVTDTYTGKMGTSGARLTVNATRLTYKGAGSEAWFTSTLDDAVIEHGRYDANAFNLIATMANEERVKVLSGRCNLGGTFIWLVLGRSKAGLDPEVVMAAGASVDRLILTAGTITGSAWSLGSDLHASGGLLEMTDPVAVAARANLCGALVRYLGSTDVSMARLQATRGSFDCAALRGLITLTGIATIGRGAVINFDNGRPAVGGASHGVDVLAGGVFKQFGTALTVQYL